MSKVLIDEEIQQFGKPLIIFHQHQESHFCINQLSWYSVEVDLNSRQIFGVAYFRRLLIEPTITL